MSWKSFIVYTIICDNCGKDLYENENPAGWDNIGYVGDDAEEQGWLITDDDKHYCPECHYPK